MASREAVAMVAAQFIQGKINQGLKPTPGSKVVDEALDLAEHLFERMDEREQEAAEKAKADEKEKAPPAG